MLKYKAVTCSGGGGGVLQVATGRYRLLQVLQVGKVPLYGLNGLKPTVSYT